MPDVVMQNTYTATGPGTARLERESLGQVVEKVYRDEAVLVTALKTTKASAIREDWGTEDIGAITVPAARSQGYVASPSAPFTPRRLDNVCQLVAEEGGVSHTKQAVETAGNVNSLAHQKMMKGQLLLFKLDKLMYARQAKQYATEPYTLATPQGYITNFLSVATTPGTKATGDGTNSFTPGTGADAFDTIAPIDTVLEKARFSRGRPRAMYMHPRRIREFSKIPDATIATNMLVVNSGSDRQFEFRGAVDIYKSDHGTVEKIEDIYADPNYIMILDPDYWEKRVLPGMDMNDYMLGKRGSGDEFGIEWQGTVVCTLPEANAIVEGYGTVTYP